MQNYAYLRHSNIVWTTIFKMTNEIPQEALVLQNLTFRTEQDELGTMWIPQLLINSAHTQCINCTASCPGNLYICEPVTHADIIKWKHFPRHWPFMQAVHGPPVNSFHKGQWRGALIFPLICAWTNVWENSRDAGDLRHHRVHYDVTVMSESSHRWAPHTNNRLYVKCFRLWRNHAFHKNHCVLVQNFTKSCCYGSY